MKSRKKQPDQFIPVFQMAFLKPKYWGYWLAIGCCAMMSLLSARIRDSLLGAIGRLVGKFSHRARRRAQINLLYCLPELSEQQRGAIIEQMFAIAAQSLMLLAELAIRNPERICQRIVWHNRTIIDELRDNGQNVIFLVPHGWSVDIPAMLMAAEGQKMAAMFHNQNNPLMDYLWNLARYRFGGRMHARNDGITPFIRSVRQGYWGYYLPDEDHGSEQSQFVDFFATYKATLPVIGRLMKVCRARVVPLFPVYDNKTHKLHIHVRPPMDDLTDADNVTLARRINEEVEIFVRPNPEQYTWILKLLKTRKVGEANPYQRDDLYSN